LAFSEYDDWSADEYQYVEFINSFKTEVDTDDCHAVYKLAVFDNDVGTFVEAWQFVDTLKEEATAWSSSIDFDSETANLYVSFSRLDIIELVEAGYFVN
jgi:hypothetical protein